MTARLERIDHVIPYEEGLFPPGNWVEGHPGSFDVVWLFDKSFREFDLWQRQYNIECWYVGEDSDSIWFIPKDPKWTDLIMQVWGDQISRKI